MKWCGNCKAQVYCSRECQKKDWPNHKKECLNVMELKKDDRTSQNNFTLNMMKKLVKRFSFSTVLSIAKYVDGTDRILNITYIGTKVPTIEDLLRDVEKAINDPIRCPSTIMARKFTFEKARQLGLLPFDTDFSTLRRGYPLMLGSWMGEQDVCVHCMLSLDKLKF